MTLPSGRHVRLTEKSILAPILTAQMSMLFRIAISHRRTIQHRRTFRTDRPSTRTRAARIRSFFLTSRARTNIFTLTVSFNKYIQSMQFKTSGLCYATRVGCPARQDWFVNVIVNNGSVLDVTHSSANYGRKPLP